MAISYKMLALYECRSADEKPFQLLIMGPSKCEQRLHERRRCCPLVDGHGGILQIMNAGEVNVRSLACWMLV